MGALQDILAEHGLSGNNANYIYLPIRDGIQTITPKQAQYILDKLNGENKRPIAPHRVALYVDHVQSGSFAKGYPISFAKYKDELFLINGQHRLKAIVSTQKNRCSMSALLQSATKKK